MSTPTNNNELWICTSASKVPVGGKLRLRGGRLIWTVARQQTTPKQTVIRRGLISQRLNPTYPVTMPVSQDANLA